MSAKAVALGRALVEAERRLDRLFASKTVTSESLSAALAEIGTLQARLFRVARAFRSRHGTQTLTSTGTSTMRKIALLPVAVLLLGLLAPTPGPAQPGSASIPNLVAVSDRVVTSGQPPAPALSALSTQGFQAVINLVPATAPGAVRDESAILDRQGIVYINIPVDLENPSQNDFDTFVGAMAAMGARKVLVHGQANRRSSAFVFLYRAIILKEPPGKAYEAVTKVWSPSPKWKQFIQGQLRTHGIPFDPV